MTTDNKIAMIDVLELMPTHDDTVTLNTRVTLNFSLELNNEEAEGAEFKKVIDSNFGSQPATFTFGDGNLLPSFEKSLIGLKVGDDRTFNLKPEDAFGPINVENIQTYPRYQFPADLMLESGLMISFSDVGGNDQAGVVKSYTADSVEIDFNHPLAGKTISFRAKIIAIEAV